MAFLPCRLSDEVEVRHVTDTSSACRPSTCCRSNIQVAPVYEHDAILKDYLLLVPPVTGRVCRELHMRKLFSHAIITSANVEQPDVDGKTVTDDGGVQWMIGCYDDTQPSNSFDYIIVQNGWNGCFASCRANANCAAFTFLGEQSGVNGAGRGYCYFKSTGGSATAFFQGTGNTFVGAVKIQYLGGSRPVSVPFFVLLNVR